MVVGLTVALVFNYDRKRRNGDRSPDAAISRRYLEVSTAF